MKKYLCQFCGETNPDSFYCGKKTKCKSCQSTKKNGIYKPQPPRKKKPHKCQFCGETNPDNFYSTKKNKCKSCQSTKKNGTYNPHKTTCVINENGLNEKIYKCHVCGETNPEKFYVGLKGRCRLCQNKHNKKPRNKKPREIKPYKCNLSKKTNRDNNKQKNKNSSHVNNIAYFIDTVIKNHGNVYGFEKSVYLGNNKPITVTCLKHNHDFSVIASTLLRRTIRNGGKMKNPIVGSCPVCREEYFIDIRNKVIEKCRKAHNNEYEYDINSYINVNQPITVICKKHGEFNVGLYTHSIGKGKCPECSKEQFLLSKNRIIIDGKYYFICEEHGNTPISKNSKRTTCPKCLEDKHRESFLCRINKKYSNGYIITPNENDISFTCKKHGEVNTFSFSEMSKQLDRNKTYICEKCLNEFYLNNKINSRINLKNKIIELINSEYSDFYRFVDIIYGENKNDHKVILYCKNRKIKKEVTTQSVLNKLLTTDLNHINKTFIPYEKAKEKMMELNITSFLEYKKWHKRTKQTELPSNPHRTYKEWVSYYDFFGKDVKDSMSLGEKKIERYLDRNNYSYIYEHKFDDCRNINPLRFDFYIPDLNTVIEFDGEQHFKPTSFSSSKEESVINYEYIKRNDEIKNQYCLKNNINLIRLDDYHLINNLIEWELDVELTKIAAEIAVKYLNNL